MFTLSETDYSIRRYNIVDGVEGPPLSCPPCRHTNPIWGLAISPDGKLLASCSRDGTVRIWDTAAGEPVGDVLEGHTDWVFGVTFSHDGQHLLSFSADSTMRIWDTENETENWETSRELTGHTEQVNCAQFFDRGKCIISGSKDCTIRIWDAESGKQIKKPLRLADKGDVRAISISPTAELVATSFYNDGYRYSEILIWDLKTRGKERCQSIWQHDVGITISLVFTSDEKRLLSAGTGGIQLWDVNSKQLIGKPWEGHTQTIRSALFLDNETRIISASDDGVIRIWDVEYDSTSSGPQAELEKSFPRLDFGGRFRSWAGWVYSYDKGKRKLLFWLPKELGRTFLWGRCQRLIGAEPTKINFTQFKHGEAWTECQA